MTFDVVAGSKVRRGSRLDVSRGRGRCKARSGSDGTMQDARKTRFWRWHVPLMPMEAGCG